MLFIFSTPELIRNLWQLKIAVSLHWCLICALPLSLLKMLIKPCSNLPRKYFFSLCHSTFYYSCLKRLVTNRASLFLMIIQMYITITTIYKWCTHTICWLNPTAICPVNIFFSLCYSTVFSNVGIDLSQINKAYFWWLFKCTKTLQLFTKATNTQ